MQAKEHDGVLESRAAVEGLGDAMGAEGALFNYSRGLRRTNFYAAQVSMLEKSINDNIGAMQQELDRQATSFDIVLSYLKSFFFGTDRAEYLTARKASKLKKQGASLMKWVQCLDAEADQHLVESSATAKRRDRAYLELKQLSQFTAVADEKIPGYVGAQRAGVLHDMTYVNRKHSARLAHLPYLEEKVRILEERGRQLTQVCLRVIEQYSMLQEQLACHESLPYLPQLPNVITQVAASAQYLEHLNAGSGMAEQKDVQDALLHTFAGTSATQPPRYLRQFLAAGRGSYGK